MLGRPSLPSLDILLPVLYSRVPLSHSRLDHCDNRLQFPAGNPLHMVLVGLTPSLRPQLWLLGEPLPCPH